MSISQRQVIGTGAIVGWVLGLGAIAAELAPVLTTRPDIQLTLSDLRFRSELASVEIRERLKSIESRYGRITGLRIQNLLAWIPADGDQRESSRFDWKNPEHLLAFAAEIHHAIRVFDRLASITTEECNDLIWGEYDEGSGQVCWSDCVDYNRNCCGAGPGPSGEGSCECFTFDIRAREDARVYFSDELVTQIRRFGAETPAPIVDRLETEARLVYPCHGKRAKEMRESVAAELRTIRQEVLELREDGARRFSVVALARNRSQAPTSILQQAIFRVCRSEDQCIELDLYMDRIVSIDSSGTIELEFTSRQLDPYEADFLQRALNYSYVGALAIEDVRGSIWSAAELPSRIYRTGRRRLGTDDDPFVRELKIAIDSFE